MGAAVSDNPYLVEGPALISFSGGRTSGYMLKMILDAHGGKLPEYVHVCFANTGMEREETLRFVYECGSRWGVRIHWLEWRDRLKRTPVEQRFEEVGFNSASRAGEPFKALITSKRYLPNVAQRWCTEHLKIQVLADFMDLLGYPSWRNVVGLRLDEMRRVAKQQRKNDAGENAWISVWPMVKAEATSRDVWKFWLGRNADPKRLEHPLPQGFDLGLYPYEGNCTYCFLKGRQILEHQERERPDSIDPWIDIESLGSSLASSGSARFVTEFTYLALKRDVARSPLLVPLDWRALEFDAECGVSGTDTSIRCGKKAA